MPSRDRTLAYKSRSYRQCEVDFELELARASSYIASSIKATTLTQTIEEILHAFLSAHGPDSTTGFQMVLADRLRARSRPDAAQQVLAWAHCAGTPSNAQDIS
jgi:hypothetical protein